MSKENKGRIENWWIKTTSYGDVVVGVIEGHPDFPDEALLRTSRVVNITEDLLETRNSLYTLGKPAHIVS